MKPFIERNQEIVNLFFNNHGMSMADIGRKYHISRQRVGRILRKYMSSRICRNCYHYQAYKYCACRDASDVVTTPNKCTDWTPINGGQRG